MGELSIWGFQYISNNQCYIKFTGLTMNLVHILQKKTL